MPAAYEATRAVSKRVHECDVIVQKEKEKAEKNKYVRPGWKKRPGQESTRHHDTDDI